MPGYDQNYDALARRQGGHPEDYLARALGQGGQAGFLQPGGAMLRDAFRRRLLGNAGARRRRQSILARLYGLDPMQQRQQALETEQETSGDLFNQLAGFDQQQIGSEQDYYRDLLRGGGYGRRPGIGSYLGQLAGTGIGAFLGGPGGGALGNRLFSGGRG
jgi:hypothetical protein